MNYWKLGCKWGRGKKPLFYEMLIKRGIVIGYEGTALIRKGDIVAVCDGFAVLALALALEDAGPCTGRPELKDDFEQFLPLERALAAPCGAEYLKMGIAVVGACA
ncbi:MAG: hypothetical protein K2F77_01860 [Muribaculaceae bacterium]|nr:hypothetical protein [Muribaculaceae bacterium]